MVETGERMGKQMVALITNMDQPLGRMVGNAMEVEECIEVSCTATGPKISANSACTSPRGCFTWAAPPGQLPKASICSERDHRIRQSS